MVSKICQDLNCYKYFKLNVETCAETLFYVFIWFYNWPDKTPENLIQHLEDVPKNGKKKLKQYFNKLEVDKMKEMHVDRSKLKGFDISFYFKLIQFAINSDEMEPLDNPVWNNNCPLNSRGELEYLLYQLKQDRNKISHKDESILMLSDKDLANYCDSLLKRLPSIIRQAGKRNNVGQKIIDEVCQRLVQQVNDIHGQNQISPIDRTALLNYIREQDLERHYLDKLKSSFNGELKSYAALEYIFPSKDIQLKTKDLLEGTDSQVIVITGCAGRGKTSLTKFLFYQWLQRNSSVVNGLASFEIVFRVPCRNINSSDICVFLEEELKSASQLLSTDANQKKVIFGYKILWILDGFDESTAAFHGFFQSLLKNLPKEHKIIITSRPDCLEDIETKLNTKHISMSSLSIKNLIEKQITEVATKFIKDESKLKDFLSFYQNLDIDSKEFMATPINLNLSLILWINNPTRLDGKLITYNLYSMSFDEQINLLVERHEDRATIRKHDLLKRRVKNWFNQFLCEVAAESLFKSVMIIHKANELKLSESAFRFGLNETFCLSTFLENEGSSTGTCYFFKHKVQQEVLASLYLKKCDTDMIKRIAELSRPCIFQNHMNHLSILFKCCDSLQFAKIFGTFLETMKSVQRPSYLMEIRNTNEEFFNVLKKKISSWEHPLELQLQCNRYEPQILKEVIEILSPDVNRFKLVLPIKNKMPIFFYKAINKVIIDLKNSNSFELVLDSTVEKKLVEIFEMFKKDENHKLIKELILHYSFWQKEAVNEVFSTQNFELDQFSAFTDCTHYSPILPCLYTCSSSTDLFSIAVHAHLDLTYGGDNPGEMLFDLLKVSKKFSYVTVDLDITNYGVPKAAVHDDWMSEFQSAMKVKKLKMKFQDIETENIYLQIANCLNTESIEFSLFKVENNLILEQDLERFLNVWKFSSLTKLKEIRFEIFLDQLIVLYDKIPPNLASKTTVTVVDEQSIIFFFKVINPDKQRNDILDSSVIPKPTEKRFMKIRIPNDLPIEDTETIESLNEITEICDFY